MRHSVRRVRSGACWTHNLLRMKRELTVSTRLLHYKVQQLITQAQGTVMQGSPIYNKLNTCCNTPPDGADL